MASVPPPQGLNEHDYETIEAAVTETVRGRWFLSEFARRNRIAETRQLLDAMARLEAAVATAPPALPSADPSIRLLIQRIREIAGQLGSVAGDMRAAGVEDRFVEAVDTQARAVSGMMRSATLPPAAAKLPEAPKPVPAPSPPRMPRAELPPALRGPTPEAPHPAQNGSQDPHSDQHPDPRLAALAGIDALPLEKKLSLFI